MLPVRLAETDLYVYKSKDLINHNMNLASLNIATRDFCCKLKIPDTFLPLSEKEYCIA